MYDVCLFVRRESSRLGYPLGLRYRSGDADTHTYEVMQPSIPRASGCRSDVERSVVFVRSVGHDSKALAFALEIL